MTLPDDVGLELGRLVDRWRVLPVDRASAVLPAIHALLVDLEKATAHREGRAPGQVPDLGPRAAMDQLTVLLQDHFAATPAPASAEDWARRIAAVRNATW